MMRSARTFDLGTRWLLENPGKPPPPFNPLDWVTEHVYMNQGYQQMLHKFIAERENSISWLQSMENANWDNSYLHETKGELSARFFLTNWLAHDYLHMRQIIRQKFDYLVDKTKTSMDNAGKW